MRKRNKSGRLPPFVALPWTLLNSEAYTTLPPSAAKLLPYFLGKPKKPSSDPEYYEVEFKFSYPEARRLGFSNGTFASCIRALVANGFVEKTQQGGLRGKGVGYNWFHLSRKWENFDEKKNKKKILYSSKPLKPSIREILKEKEKNQEIKRLETSKGNGDI